MFRDRFSRRDRFFRGTGRESSFQKGDLKYVILDLLKDKPRHGYEIIRELEEQSMGTYKPSPGAVYPTLQMFEDMGYTTTTERDGKKIYTVTEEGLKFLAERKESADEVRSHMKRRWISIYQVFHTSARNPLARYILPQPDQEMLRPLLPNGLPWQHL